MAIGLRFLHHPEKERILTTNQTREWFTKRRTLLVLKDKEKAIFSTNFRTIPCLPLMWKLFTGIMGYECYKQLEEDNLLPDVTVNWQDGY